MIQAKRLLRFTVGGPVRQRRVKDIVAQVLEEASVETVGSLEDKGTITSLRPISC